MRATEAAFFLFSTFTHLRSPSHDITKTSPDLRAAGTAKGLEPRLLVLVLPPQTMASSFCTDQRSELGLDGQTHVLDSKPNLGLLWRAERSLPPLPVPRTSPPRTRSPASPSLQTPRPGSSYPAWVVPALLTCCTVTSYFPNGSLETIHTPRNSPLYSVHLSGLQDTHRLVWPSPNSIFNGPKRNLVPISSHSSSLPNRPRPWRPSTCFRSLQICPFWPFCTHSLRQFVFICVRLLSLRITFSITLFPFRLTALLL